MNGQRRGRLETVPCFSASNCICKFFDFFMSPCIWQTVEGKDLLRFLMFGILALNTILRNWGRYRNVQVMRIKQLFMIELLDRF